MTKGSSPAAQKMQIRFISRMSPCALALFALLIVGSAGNRALALDKGQAAPEIALKDFSGTVRKLSGLKGKIVLVDFWASWCGPCRESMPFLDRLSTTYKDKGLVVIGVNIDSDLAAAQRFLKNIPVSFAVLNDADKQVAKAYGPPTMPSSYVIDRQGKVRAIHAGFTTSDAVQLEMEIKALL